MDWYRTAAEQGYADAQNNLGVCYETGAGVPKDLVQAASWYRKAAEQGQTIAQYNLGVCYKNGTGVPKDAAQAAAWYRRAANQGDADAQSTVWAVSMKTAPACPRIQLRQPPGIAKPPTKAMPMQSSGWRP